MAPQVPALIEQSAAPTLRQADTDQQLIETWLGRHQSEHTRQNYRRQAARLIDHAGKPLGHILVSDLQAYLTTLADQAPATRANATAALNCSTSPMTSAICHSTLARPSRRRRSRTPWPSAS